MPVLPINKSIQCPGRQLAGLTWDGKSLWVTDCGEGVLVRFSPEGSLLGRLPCQDATTGLTYKDDALWQVVHDGQLRKLRTDTGQSALHSIASYHGELCGIEWTPKGLWMGYAGVQESTLRLVGHDGATCVTEIPLVGIVSGVTAIDHDSVLWADYAASSVTMMSVSSGLTLGVFDLNGHPTGITWDGNHLWYCDEPGGRTAR